MIDAKRIIILTVSHHGEEAQMRKCLSAAMTAGTGLLLIDEGASEVAFARNLILTRLLDELPPNSVREVATCIDDDISFTLANLLKLADEAWTSGNPTAGIYVNGQGQIQAELNGKNWETGLGFFAIPIPVLRAAASRISRVKHRAYPPGIYPFCQSGIHPETPEEWCPEDKWLCRTLRPVAIGSVIAAHIRKIGLEPTSDSVADVIKAQQILQGGAGNAQTTASDPSTEPPATGS